MTDREKLIELLYDFTAWEKDVRLEAHYKALKLPPFIIKHLADDLISKGVTIPVRCGECIEAEWDEESELYLCRHQGCDYNKGEHFCSYGERREDVKV